MKNRTKAMMWMSRQLDLLSRNESMLTLSESTKGELIEALAELVAEHAQHQNGGEVKSHERKDHN